MLSPILCPINTALIIKFDYVIKYLYNNDIDKRLLATPRLNKYTFKCIS